jgi:hypothetical protein
MKNRTHFAHRVDAWDDEGSNVIEHLAGVEDFEVAMATYRAACQRWPNAAITLRQGARVIKDSDGRGWLRAIHRLVARSKPWLLDGRRTFVQKIKG